MAGYSTTQDCLNAALHWAGELETTHSTQSEFRQKGLDYINRAYLAIMSGASEFDLDLNEPFTWARNKTPGIVTFQPNVANIVSINLGATTGTFGTIPVDALGAQTSMAGRYLKVPGFADMVLILTHIAASTTFTIDEPWTGNGTQSNTVGAACNMYLLNYNLIPGIIRLIAPMRIYKYQGNMSGMGAQSGGELLGSDLPAMLREYPLYAISTYVPNRFAIQSTSASTKTDGTDDSVINIRINSDCPYLSRAEYDYIPFPTTLTDSTSSIPVVPLNHRVVLAYAAAYFILLDKYDDRSQEFLKQTQGGLRALKRADEAQRTEINPFRGRLIPRKDLVKRSRFLAGY